MAELHQEVCSVFVYGTLKLGQERGGQWPRKPLAVQCAWTRGRLYDTGPYPALVQGTDLVAGELWSFRADDMHATLSVLDEIEGTNQPGEQNYYDREVVSIWHTDDANTACVDAYIYFFARHSLLSRFRYIEPHLQQRGQAFAIWPRNEPTWASDHD